jgi:hypothetical protein
MEDTALAAATDTCYSTGLGVHNRHWDRLNLVLLLLLLLLCL